MPREAEDGMSGCSGVWGNACRGVAEGRLGCPREAEDGRVYERLLRSLGEYLQESSRGYTGLPA